MDAKQGTSEAPTGTSDGAATGDGAGELAGGGDGAARTELDLDHPTEAVWRALVDPVRLGRWMGPGSGIEPWPGGRVTVDDPATGTPRRGRVTKVDEGRQLDLEWWPEDDPDGRTDVSFVLAERPGGSTLTVIEALPPAAALGMRALACARAASSWRLATLAVVGLGNDSLVVDVARPAPLVGVAGTLRHPVAAGRR